MHDSLRCLDQGLILSKGFNSILLCHQRQWHCRTLCKALLLLIYAHLFERGLGLGAGQSSHCVILQALAPSPISNLNRSSFHSVYMSMVALMASLCPGPTLAGRASAKLRHMPSKRVNPWGVLRLEYRGTSTCSQIPPVFVRQSKPIFQ